MANSKHIVALPYAAEGHVSPMMHLCVFLAERGFSITFVAMSGCLYDAFALINSKGEWPPSRYLSSIRIKQLNPVKSFPMERGDPKSVLKYHEMFTTPMEELLNELALETPICCIICEFIHDWCIKLAARLGIRGVVHYSLPATAALCGLNLGRLFADEFVQPARTEIAEDDDCVLPGIPDTRRSEIPWHFWVDETHRDFLFRLCSDVFRMADLTIVNSCMELEGDGVTALSSELHNKVLPVGPLFLLNRDEAHTVGFGVSKLDCLHWLDAQPRASVLYISFGSYADLSASEFEEIASGLEASGVRFLWVIRHGTSSEDASVRFTGSEKGLVVPWCPQTKVLAHPSVGAFLSHCGWNSMLEAAAFGKPVLCWPLLFEQNTNAGMLVRKWKTGAKFARGSDGIVDRGEVERVVRAVMEGDEGKLMRQRAEELSEKVRANNAPSSGLEKFIHILSQGW